MLLIHASLEACHTGKDRATNPSASEQYNGSMASELKTMQREDINTIKGGRGYRGIRKGRGTS